MSHGAVQGFTVAAIPVNKQAESIPQTGNASLKTYAQRFEGDKGQQEPPKSKPSTLLHFKPPNYTL